MTVCIGALADDGRTLVAVADKMLSINAPMAYQYENEDVCKIYDLKENVIAMYDGTTNLADEIIKNAIAVVAANNPESVKDTAEIVKDEYQKYRLDLFSEAILQPHNLTIEEYKANQKDLNQEVVNSIEKSLTEFDLQINIIVCGIDSTGGHIYTISNPGLSVLNDGTGYACLGIGAPHAMYSIINSGYTKALDKVKVEKLVDEAKKMAENAPGVGKLTDKKIITESGPKKNGKQ
jgi:hypothetical protein